MKAIVTAEKLIARVAKMTDAEVLDVLAMAKANGSDRHIIMAMTAEATYREILD